MSVDKRKAAQRVNKLDRILYDLWGKIEQDDAEIQVYDDLISLFQNILKNDEYVKYSPEVQNSIKNIIANLKMLKEEEKKEMKIEEEAAKILQWLLDTYKANYGLTTYYT